MGRSSQSSRSGLQCGVLEVAEILWTDRDFGSLQKGEGHSRAAAGFGCWSWEGHSYLLQGELTTYRMECLGRDLEGEDSVQPMSEIFMEMVLQKRGWG